MKTKKVEFSKAEEVLERLGKVLESLYSAHTSSDERKRNKLCKSLYKLISEEEKDLQVLEGQKGEIRRIQARILDGTNEAMLDNPELLNNWINSRINAGGQNAADISKGMAYKSLQDSYNKTIEATKKVEKSIANIESIISTKVENSKASKEIFACNYETFINNFCNNGKNTIQKIKVSLAGDKISLKNTSTAEYSLSLSDLSKLNKIANLFESMVGNNEKKNKNSIELNSIEAQIADLRNEISVLDETSNVTTIKINSEEAKLKKANIKNRKYAMTKAFFALINLEKEDPVYQKLVTEKSKQELIINNALNQIKELFNNSSESRLTAKEKKEKVEELLATYKSLNSLDVKLDNKYNYTRQFLINVIRSYLENPNINIRAGIDTINGIVEKSPYEVATLKRSL